MEIYTFDKSLQERLGELTEILSSRGEIVPASQIQSEWSYHVELVIEPVGWQALWKLSRLTCEDFHVHYPTIVVVEVETVDFAELSALVKITAVQDEIHLPEKYDVPLTELYVTLSQENDVLDVVGTASCIDQLRFFYNYLWMPWDLDDDDNADWVSMHLETRIRLFFDTKRGLVSKETGDVIRSLIREGRDIQQHISQLEESISDGEELQDGLADEGRTCQLMKLHFRLQQIKAEMEVLENPAMREVLVRNRSLCITNKRGTSRESKDRQVEGYLVWLGGYLDDIKGTIDKAQSFLPPKLFLKVSSSFQETLHTCDTGDIIMLGEGNHRIRNIGNLEEGGTVRGIHNLEGTIISAKDSENAPSLLDFSGDEVLLDNITLDVGLLRAAIIIRTGTTKIINCKICALNQSMVKLGVVVLPSGKLIIENTVFEGLGTAIVIYEKGEVLLNSCSFKSCAEGVQLHDNARLSATNCCFGNFNEYAIRMETQKYLQYSESKCGSSELLQDISEICLNECRFEANGKGDVALKPRASIALTAKQDEAVNMETK